MYQKIERVMKMKIKHKYLYFVVLLLVTLISSMNMVQIKPAMQTSYTPTIGDVATFKGKIVESEKNFNGRFVTDDTNITMVDYQYESGENKSIDSITNFTAVIYEVGTYGTESFYGVNLTIEGFHNATGSYTQSINDSWDTQNQQWDNTSVKTDYTPVAFSNYTDEGYPYSIGQVPSSFRFGDEMPISIGLMSMPFGAQPPFNDISYLNLTWSTVDQNKRPYTINGLDFLLSTKTYKGVNITSLWELGSVSMGGPLVEVNQTLDAEILVSFEFDVVTGYLLQYNFSYRYAMGMKMDKIEAELGPGSGIYGFMEFSNEWKTEICQEFVLVNHSALFLTVPTPSSSASTEMSTTSSTNATSTSTSTSASETSGTSGITSGGTAFTALVTLSLVSLVIINRKRRKIK